MNVVEILSQLRSTWIRRVTNDMARGTEVRDNFEEQIDRFFGLLTHAAETGDPAWIDPVLRDWSATPSQSDLREGQNNTSAILSRMLIIVYELARENLDNQQALELLGILLPIFTYALATVAQYETESRVSFVSNELAEVQQKLERLDRTKSNFISVAAHELKTPLTLIEGYTAMMRETPDQPGGESLDPLIEGVNNGIRRLRSIVDDMIDVTRIDNNLLSLHFQPVWLSNLFQLLRSDLSGFITNRHLIVEVNAFPGIDQMIYADAERLYQAFRNLLSNAIKYTPDGGRVNISGRILPGFIEVIIEDTGIGISAQDQELIFAKFGQVGNSQLHSSGKTKFKGGGPGLGLPIARGIIEAHGGTIWVESEGYDEEKCPGSTFHVLLPLRTEPPDPKLAKLFSDPEKKDTIVE